MNKTRFRFAFIGECMIELSHKNPTNLKMAFAGDTLNVAVYFARSIDSKDFEVQYITALGRDRYSEEMLEFFNAEGVGHSFIRRISDKLPGLYLIQTDDKGDRSFYFYRQNSAARLVFEGEEGRYLCDQLVNFNGIFLSSIAIAILDDKQRTKLFNGLQKAREKGTQIFFDTNFRPALWSSKEQAREVTKRFLTLADIALPSFDDEQKLFGDQDYAQCAARFHSYGVKELVIKHGEKGYFLSVNNFQEFFPVIPEKNVVDTTGAGDSFNGAYLASRLQGKTIQESSQIAATLAAKVIQFPGAIIPA